MLQRHNNFYAVGARGPPARRWLAMGLRGASQPLNSGNFAHLAWAIFIPKQWKTNGPEVKWGLDGASQSYIDTQHTPLNKRPGVSQDAVGVDQLGSGWCFTASKFFQFCSPMILFTISKISRVTI